MHYITWKDPMANDLVRVLGSLGGSRGAYWLHSEHEIMAALEVGCRVFYLVGDAPSADDFPTMLLPVYAREQLCVDCDTCPTGCAEDCLEPPV